MYLSYGDKFHYSAGRTWKKMLNYASLCFTEEMLILNYTAILYMSHLAVINM